MIKEALKAIGNILKSIKESIAEALYSLKIQKKAANKFSAEIDIISDTRKITTYKGQITPNKILCLIPALKRIIFNPIMYEKENKNRIIISDNQHDNLLHATIIKLSQINNTIEITTKLTPKIVKEIKTKLQDTKINHEILDSWGYNDIWATIEVKHVNGSIDFKQFDNEYSVPFAAQSELIIDSELLKFLTKPSDMTILTTAIIGFLAGMVIMSLMGAA
jgi:hypothetical protein